VYIGCVPALTALFHDRNWAKDMPDLLVMASQVSPDMTFVKRLQLLTMPVW
jgi:hypothetical protein